MYGPEIRQLRADFDRVPYLVDRYVRHAPADEARRFVRVVGGVTNYLSRMAANEARILEGHLFGTLGVVIDEITDEQQEEISVDTFKRAFNGKVDDPRLHVARHCAHVARSPEFEDRMLEVVRAQNQSLEQFEDPGRDDIQSVTYRKGGATGVANLHLVKQNVSSREEFVAHEFGVVMQLLDDYLDKPDDEADGIATLFTEGHYGARDLEHDRKRVMKLCKGEWGNSRAFRRFSRITRLHRYAGLLRNHTPIEPRWFCPWYI